MQKMRQRQNATAATPPRTPLGELTTLLDPLVGWGGDTPPHSRPHSAPLATPLVTTTFYGKVAPMGARLMHL